MSLRSVAAAAIPSPSFAQPLSVIGSASWGTSSPSGYEFSLAPIPYASDATFPAVSLFAERPSLVVAAAAAERLAPVAADKSAPSPDEQFFYSVFEYLRNPEIFSDAQRRKLQQGVGERLMKMKGARDSAAPKKDAAPKKTLSTREILAPLDTVFLPDEDIDFAIDELGVEDLMNGEIPTGNGAIFNGPPGTGKTVLLRAIDQIYQNCGAVAKEFNLSKLTEKFVASFANNLTEAIEAALKEANEKGMPCFIWFDEASVAVSKVNGDNSSADYFQQALDVLKRYIGNTPGLVVAFSTNFPKDRIDDALSRDGRLALREVKLPQLPEQIRMWEHFLKLHGVMEGLTPEQLRALAMSYPRATGAAVEKFTRVYVKKLIAMEIREKGFKNKFEALKAGLHLDKADVEDLLTFENLLAAVKKQAADRSESDAEKPRRYIGYGRPENASQDRELAEKRQNAA